MLEHNEKNNNSKNHPFHIIDPSPWPLLISMAALILAIGAVLFMHSLNKSLFFVGLLSVVGVLFFWFKDILKESNEKGVYTQEVQNGLKLGVVFFIISEVMLFITFFWSYFHSAFNLTKILDFTWPPANIITIDPMELPYLNTLLLLLSGTSVTWAHYELIKNNLKNVSKGLLITILLGLIFSGVQVTEYIHAKFSIKDGIYPSNFYMATGFHGGHVILGSILLAVCYFRNLKKDFDSKNHIGFEAAAWYWHFVDVVWLFLFVSIYLLGSK